MKRWMKSILGYSTQINYKNYLIVKSGYMDQNDCTWYHENWMILRYLGVVSNPFWHEDFYEKAIRQYVNELEKVLILGTADFSMPYLCQMKGIKK